MFPDESFLIMYGPVATWCIPYVEVVWESNRFAYSCGTGAVISNPSEPVKTPSGRLSRNTIVSLLGVWMPLMSGTPFVAFLGAPTTSPKYAPA
jgi:hypothetical protein